MRPQTIVGLLAEPRRLSVFAALVLGARTPTEVGESTGLDPRSVHTALQRLTNGGLVDRGAHESYLPNFEAFRQAARSAARPVEEHGYTDERVEAVIRTFVREGRLAGLPVQLSRRRMVLEHVVQSFEPGRDYSEREVDTVLRAWTEGGGVDHVTVRRYLVDEGLLSRSANNYRRSGGWVDVLG
jgi:hypothetical protein